METIKKGTIFILFICIYIGIMTKITYAAYFGETEIKENEICISKLKHGHKVSYELNGGIWADGYIPPNSRLYEEELLLPSSEYIRKDGYTFGGWYMNADYLGEAQSVCGTDQKGDITYYAKWCGNAYLMSGMKFNETLKTLANGASMEYNTYDYLIKGVQWADEVPEGSKTEVVTEKTSDSEIIAFFDSDNGIINLVNPDDAKVYMDFDSSYMFNRFDALTFVDMSKFISEKVTDIKYIFSECASLEEFSMKDFDTSSVTTLKAIFAYCENLRILDLSGWNVEKVQVLSSMFIECSALESVNFEGWNPCNATEMASTFSGCINLKSVNIANWDTGKLTSTYYMFSRCSSLTNLDLSGWNTPSLTRTQRMFDDCKKLQTVDMRGWNTSNVTNMANMFQNNYMLKELRLDQFDMSSVTNKGGMMSKAANTTRRCTIYCTEETEAALLSGTSITANSFKFVRPEPTVTLTLFVMDNNFDGVNTGEMSVASKSNAEETEEMLVASGSNAEEIEEMLVASGSNAEEFSNIVVEAEICGEAEK